MISPAPSKNGRSEASALQARFKDHTAVVGVIGLGYVGLPLAVEMARFGYRTIGFDLSDDVVGAVNRGDSPVGDVPDDVLRAFVGEELISATTDLHRLGDCDALAICVPTPLSKTRDPDMACVLAATRSVRAALRPGQLVILESTTYPGTTRELLLSEFEQTGLTAGKDFFLCFSPERVDPGNPTWHTRNTPKVLGGVTESCLRTGMALYEQVFDQVVPVSSTETAELVKLYENTFRMINIALVNELAQVCDRLGVDVWEVIDAAATKPFGFMKFTPGPGLGGHCIPLDPHYLSWKMRTLAFRTRMIEVASEINAEMPAFVVAKIRDALNTVGKSVKGSQVLLLGVAYKKNVGDVRESPALDIIGMLQDRGAEVRFHDPYCQVIDERAHRALSGLPLRSVPLTRDAISQADCVVITTDHDDLDYPLVRSAARLVVDGRGVMRRVAGNGTVLGLSRAERAWRLTPASA